MNNNNNPAPEANGTENMFTTRIRTFSLISLALALSALALSACGDKQADISAYENDVIVVSGLPGGDFTITPKDLIALDCVSRTAAGATEKAGTVAATGPLLDTFLAEYGCKASDFDRIRFIASDGYRTVLRGDYLTDYEVVMSVSSGSEPLAEGLRPMRLLIPEAESGMWIYAVIRIEFVFPAQE